MRFNLFIGSLPMPVYAEFGFKLPPRYHVESVAHTKKDSPL